MIAGTREGTYLNDRERAMLEDGAFFGGWEDADPDRTTLAPLEAFDHPQLHTVRMAQPEWDPVEGVAEHMAKAMAGAPRRFHVDARELREALQAGTALTLRQRVALNNMVASCKMWEMHAPFTAWGLSIYHLARVVALNYDGKHTWTSWLNLWADDPDRPLPAPPRLRPWNPKTHPPFRKTR